MNPELILNVRYKLQRRVRRLHSAHFPTYHQVLQHFWNYLRGNVLFTAIIEELRGRVPDAKAWADRKMQSNDFGVTEETEYAAICSFFVERCANENDVQAEIHFGHAVNPQGDFNDCIETFHESYVEPFYDYIDEQIDDKGAVLASLVRYQHRIEWFHRERLHRAWDENTVRGEKALALDLYEYLYEQGIEFYIEPYSVSGDVDLIGAQTGPEPLLPDVKIFCPERSKGETYLKRGFHQLYTYCRDHNQACGYLVIFNLTPDNLRILTKNQSQSVSYVTHNNKTIFFVVIDLYLHTVSASKRGIMECRELREEDLFRDLPSDEEPLAGE
jgi:hypothetical protein